MLGIFRPDHRVQSVAQLAPEWLRGERIASLLLDADCTLKRYREEEPTPEAQRWLDELRAAGIGVCLVSNGRGPRIGRFAARCGLPFIAGALKPLPFGCRRAIRQMGFRREETAMVGDQLFADIAAGHLAGVRTILVEPIHPEDEPWFTRLKRPLERLFLPRP